MTQQQIPQNNGQQNAVSVQRRAASQLVEAMTAEWAKVLPSVCTPERFARVALSCINGNPRLAQTIMTPSGKASLCAAFMKCAEVGLEPNGRDAHIIPYMLKGQPSVQFQLDYKGLVQLARRSGEIQAIIPGVVKDNDSFTFENGVIKHSIDFKQPSRGNSYAWYVRVIFKDGSEQADVMNKEEVEAIRRRSKSPNNGPWVTDYDAMATKTVFKRLSKWLPLSYEASRAIQLDNEDERDNSMLDITPNGDPKRQGRFAEFQAAQQKLTDAFVDSMPPMVASDGHDADREESVNPPEPETVMEDNPIEAPKSANAQQPVADAQAELPLEPARKMTPLQEEAELEKALKKSGSPVTVGDVKQFCSANGIKFAPIAFAKNSKKVANDVIDWQLSQQEQEQQ